MSTEQDLMPCPFCGGKARLDQRVTQSLWNSSDAVFSHVACDECDISGQDFCDDPAGEEAIEWWNRRDPQSARQQAADHIPEVTKMVRAAAPQAEQVVEALDERMRAAGMMTTEEMLAGAPLDGFIKHANVNDLETYGQWLDMKCREFLTMQAKRELNKDPEDDMYEWVIAHAAVFQEARINFNAARTAPPTPDVSALVEALEDIKRVAEHPPQDKAILEIVESALAAHQTKDGA